MVDTRKPSVMRVAPVPLYNSFDDVRCAAVQRPLNNRARRVSEYFECCSARILQVYNFVMTLREVLSEVAPGTGL